MVTVFLRGGLGNQMFQYAAGLALAKKNNTHLALDTVFLNDRFPRRNFTYREYSLDIFSLEQNLTTLSRISGCVPIPGVWLAADLLSEKARSMIGIRSTIREVSETAFQPGMLSARGEIVLWGRWQNEKYFNDYAQEVRAAFTFKQPLSGGAHDIAEAIENSNSVSFHVRRGDYVSFKNIENMMGPIDTGYYDRAVAHIAERVKNPHLFIFSDDIAWCREHIAIPYPATYVDPSTAGPKSSFHLHMMSLCKNNIIANSTYSWWGAWLNANPAKIVVAPKRWYANEAVEGGLVPAAWIRM